MSQQDFTATLSFDQTPDQVFAAINDVRSWWTGEIEGPTDVLGGSFTYRHGDVHRSTHEVTELVPGQRVVWRVTESHLSFVGGDEWKGTQVVFDLRRVGEGTEVRFTHVGLVPTLGCYAACSRGWSHFVTDSLAKRVRREPRARPAESRGER
ncbi:MAG: SRPBCC domain-containing protein [Myxococcales bacterium]|nr:SRPBCC domain-containing protein [Myxococcales bacterium]